MAPPTYAWSGTDAAGSTTAADPAYPASGVNSGDAIYLHTMNKASTGQGTADPPALAAISGWTEVATGVGGTGSAGDDTGKVRVTVHRRDADADGTENGVTLTNLVDNPTNSSYVKCSLFGLRRATAGTTIFHGTSAGGDTSSDTAFSVTVAADVGITTDDLLVAMAGYDTDTPTSSLGTMSATGATIGTVTERYDRPTTSGNDGRLLMWTAACTAGTSSAAATFGATMSVAATGCGLLMRVLEVMVTATPSTVAATASIPTPTAQGGAVATPSAVAIAAAIPTPTVTTGGGGDATATPATVAAVATVPTPTAQAGAEATPATVAATVSVPGPAVSTGSTAGPGTVAAGTSIPTPEAQGGAVALPATVAAVVRPGACRRYKGRPRGSSPPRPRSLRPGRWPAPSPHPPRCSPPRP